MSRAVSFAAGAVAAAAIAALPTAAGLPEPESLALAIIGAFVVACVAVDVLGSRRTGPRRLTVAAVGAGLVALRIAAQAPDPTVAAGTGTWTATVVAISSARDGHVPLELALDVPGGTASVAATVPPYPVIGTGDRVRVSGEYRPPDGPAPARVFVRSVERVSGGSPVDDLRRAVGDAVASVLPEPEAGLAEGMLVGLRERVDRGLAADFTAAGVSHVVAISGWNVSLVIAALAPLLGRVRRGPRAVVLVLAIAGFVVFAGASASVVRAGVMTSLVVVARSTGRAGAASSALALAIAGLVIAEPASVGDPGLQLSASATVGLMLWGSTVGGRLRPHVPAVVPDGVVETFALSLAAEAATLPFVLADFGRLSVVAPIANILVAPLVAPSMAVAAVGALGGVAGTVGIPGPLTLLLALPGWAVLGAMIALVRLAAAVPFASVLVPAPFGAIGGLAVGAVIAFVAVGPKIRRGARRDAVGNRPRASRVASSPRPSATARTGRPGPQPAARRVVAVAALGAVVALAVLVSAAGVLARPPGTIRVTVLDVGQGDAILVEGDLGSRMLVDGGPDPQRLLTVLDSRLPPWDRRVDVLVLTHPHEDHAAGLATLVERYAVHHVFEPGMEGPGPGYRAFEAALEARGVAAGRLTTGDRLSVDGLGLRVLWPDRNAVPRTPPDGGTSINNVSIVLLGTFGPRRMLLAGDVEQAIDPILLRHGLAHVDLLKVAHHGSATSSTDPLLDVLRPAVAVVSVGARNPYGHPSAATLGRLRAHGADVYRTDRNGTVEVDVGADGLELSRERGDAEGSARVSTPADAVRSSTAAGRPASVPLLACAIQRAPGIALANQADTQAAATRPGTPGEAGYDRVRDGALADAGRLAPARARPADVVPPALEGRGGGRVVACARSATARGRRPSGRRDGGAPPRRRQAPEGGVARASPRRRFGCVAPIGRSRGARPARRRPPGHAPRRARLGRVARGRVARGRDRRVRRQARRSTPRADGRPLRGLDAPVPRREGMGRGDAPAGMGECAATRGTRLRRDRSPPAGRGARRVDGLCDPCRARDLDVSGVPLAYLRGDDEHALGRALDAFVASLATGGEMPERWRTTGDDTDHARLAERLGTAPMFGAGTVAVVSDPGPLVRSAPGRAATIDLLGAVAPGNGLAFVEASPTGSKPTAGLEALRAAVGAAGGDVRDIRAPSEGRMVGWIEEEARQRGVRLGPGAAQELSERVGAAVREADVDRRRMSALAAAELDKLALYRPEGQVSREDVAELVSGVTSVSTWAFLDAIGERKARRAAELLDRLLATTPEPVLLAQLHRRIRELLEIADLLAAGTPESALVRQLKLNPYRATRLAGQARRWRLEELDAALAALLDLDAAVKGADPASARQVALLFQLWVRDRVGDAPARGG